MLETQQTELLTDSFSEVWDETAQIVQLESELPLRYSLKRALATLYHERLQRYISQVHFSHAVQPSRLTQNESLYNAYHDQLSRHLDPQANSHVLEVGCGSGKFCHTLVERGYRSYGIDLSHALLQQARQIAPGCEFERASAYESYEDLFYTSFDAIVYLDAIEHLHSPRRFIQTAVESLSPGGLLVVSARYQGRLMSLTSALTGHHELEDELLWRSSCHQNLNQVLEDSGLEIVESQGHGSQLPDQRSRLFVARKSINVN